LDARSDARSDARYANALIEVKDALNKRLPKIEEQLGEAHGIALAAHGIASRLESRLEDIAEAVKAPSLAMKAAVASARSIPPPPPEKLEINYNPSPTGSHFTVDQKELERLERKFAEQEAEKRGAREALAARLAEEDRKREEDDRKEELQRKKNKEFRDRVLFVGAILSAAGALATWFIEHVVLK
jgi:hypothetical protein